MADDLTSRLSVPPEMPSCVAKVINSAFKEKVERPCVRTDVRPPSPPIFVPKVLLRMFTGVINMSNNINDVADMSWPKCD